MLRTRAAAENKHKYHFFFPHQKFLLPGHAENNFRHSRVLLSRMLTVMDANRMRPLLVEERRCVSVHEILPYFLLLPADGGGCLFVVCVLCSMPYQTSPRIRTSLLPFVCRPTPVATGATATTAAAPASSMHNTAHRALFAKKPISS